MSGELRSRRVLFGAGLFVLSGAASLMDQVVWLRLLGLVFGNTTYAATTLLAVFMAGLGLGAFLFGRWADRLLRPLVVFALAETAVGLVALLSPLLLGSISRVYVALYGAWGNQPMLFALGRALLAAAVLLPPTALMGATLPLLVRGLAHEKQSIGGLTALLYALNTLGAVAGTALAGFVSVRILGLTGTLAIAASFHLLAALGALLISQVRRRTATAGASPSERAPWGYLALFCAMGATSLGYEVLWTRILVFYLGSSVYAFSLMLVLFLVGIGTGSLAITPWVDRIRRPLLALAGVELGIALCAVLQVVGFQKLNAALVGWARILELQTFSGVVAVQFAAALPILLPPTFLMGISFPLAVRLVGGSGDRAGRDVGGVYGANTLGAVAGSLLVGFVAIPWIGTQNSLVAVGVVNAGLGAGLLVRGTGWRWRWVGLAAPAAALVALAAFPPDRVILAAGLFRRDAPEDLVAFSEDASTSVTVRRLPSESGPYLSLELNGVNVAGTSPDLWAVQMMQGHLPMLLASQPKKVVHIGFGSGGTAWAVSRHPVESILVVEISPPVLEAADRYFESINHGVLADSRVRVEINDGRNFLLATRERFDAVLSDSIHPRYAGNGSLYTRDYFEIARERLEPGGVISMWLPMYTLTPRNYKMILRAFREVFPETVVWYEPTALNSFTIVTGRVEPGGWDGETLRRAFADPRVRAELEKLKIRGPAELLACYLVGPDELEEWLADVPAHTDDVPSVEYESGLLMRAVPSWYSTFSTLVSLRPEDPPASYLEALDPAERERAVERFRARRAGLSRHVEVLAARLAGKNPGRGPVPKQAPPG